MSKSRGQGEGQPGGTVSKKKAAQQRPSESRARARKATTDEVVDAIIQQMVASKWRRGISDKEFADRYQLSLSRIQDLSAEASRAVKRTIEDAEEIRSGLYATLADIVVDARENGDRRAAVQAVGEIAKLLGLQKSAVELTGKDGGPVATAASVVVLPPENDDGEADPVATESGATGEVSGD